MKAQLRPFLRPGLDVLFVALNPPAQSNSNGHYFSGARSRFFKLLALSGLTTHELPKNHADELVFGSTKFNYSGAAFGVIDLVEDLVETNSGRVRAKRHHVEKLLSRIHEFEPRFVCVIHSKVRDALQRYGNLLGPLDYGCCGKVIPESATGLLVNYFPNGNSIPDGPKLQIFRDLRDLL